MNKEAWLIYFMKPYSQAELQGVFVGTRQEVSEMFLMRKRVGHEIRLEHTDEAVKAFVPSNFHGEIFTHKAIRTQLITE